MSKDFRIYQDGDRQIIERLSYPRFKGVITFNSPLSDIEEIELLDETRDPSVIYRGRLKHTKIGGQSSMSIVKKDLNIMDIG